MINVVHVSDMVKQNVGELKMHGVDSAILSICIAAFIVHRNADMVSSREFISIYADTTLAVEYKVVSKATRKIRPPGPKIEAMDNEDTDRLNQDASIPLERPLSSISSLTIPQSLIEGDNDDESIEELEQQVNHMEKALRGLKRILEKKKNRQSNKKMRT